MKKFIVPSVLASLLFILPARANENNGNNDYCVSPKSTGNCLNTVPRQAYPTPHLPGPQPGNVGNGYGNGWYHGNTGAVYLNFQSNPYDDNYDENYNYDDSYNDDDNYNDSYVDRCTSIGQSLRHSGFRRVKAIGCAGRNYVYTAFRDGDRLRITVSRNSGRIIKIRPLY